MSGRHCEVAQVTNRLTWSSAVGLEQREDSHIISQARPSTRLARYNKKQTIQCDGIQLDKQRRC
jgi:hypothetical protein